MSFSENISLTPNFIADSITIPNRTIVIIGIFPCMVSYRLPHYIGNSKVSAAFLAHGGANGPGEQLETSDESTVYVLVKFSQQLFCSGGGFLSVAQWSSVKQGTQHFTDENKVSRK